MPIGRTVQAEERCFVTRFAPPVYVPSVFVAPAVLEDVAAAIPSTGPVMSSEGMLMTCPSIVTTSPFSAVIVLEPSYMRTESPAPDNVTRWLSKVRIC